MESLNVRVGKALSESVDIITLPSSIPILLVCNFQDTLVFWGIMLFAKLDMYTAKLYPAIMKTRASYASLPLFMWVELVGGGKDRNVLSICYLQKPYRMLTMNIKAFVKFLVAPLLVSSVPYCHFLGSTYMKGECLCLKHQISNTLD